MNQLGCSIGGQTSCLMEAQDSLFLLPGYKGWKTFYVERPSISSICCWALAGQGQGPDSHLAGGLRHPRLAVKTACPTSRLLNLPDAAAHQDASWTKIAALFLAALQPYSFSCCTLNSTFFSPNAHNLSLLPVHTNIRFPRFELGLGKFSKHPNIIPMIKENISLLDKNVMVECANVQKHTTVFLRAGNYATIDM